MKSELGHAPIEVVPQRPNATAHLLRRFAQRIAVGVNQKHGDALALGQSLQAPGQRRLEPPVL
jgi:hypothetical protein